MEIAREKKKKGKSRSQENVPLHDIIQPKQGGENQPNSPQVKKKRPKKNEVSPEIVTSSVASIESTIKQDAWAAGENPSPEKSPVKAKEKGGVANPALVMNDEPALPGSVPDLKSPSLDKMPISSTAVNNTIIDNNDGVTIMDAEQQNIEDVKPPPGTPQEKSSSPTTPKSSFHRALFGRSKNRTKVAAIENKEIDGRPSTAPGYRLPFPNEFNGSTPQLKRPATAAAHGMRKPKSGRLEISESMPSLRENTFNVSTRSLKDPPEITRSAVAYVPYLHARNTLSRVIEDMKNMKMSHLAIVTEIEEQYKGIEIESREQFNAYVIALQDEQRNKINLFKQTIEEHNAEVKERNNFWNEQLQSLKKRNKQLLRQKRALFIARQEDAQRFEKEKEELQSKLSGQDSKIRQVEKEDGSRVILDGTDPAEDRTDVIETVAAGAATVVVAQEIGDKFDQSLIVASSAEANKWKERYEKERQEHLDHGRRLEKEMQQVKALLASKGASSLQERSVYEEKIKELSKEMAKLQIEYDTTSAFLQSLMASIDSDEQYYAAKKKIEDDRVIMHEEQTRLQSEIADWQDDWKKSHDGKLPDDDEKPDSAKELDTQLAEAELMLAKLDKQEEALIMLKEGRTPKATESIPEPVVTTIEVKDPKLVQELEADKIFIVNLEDKLKATEMDAIRISDLENENADLRSQLLDYEKQLESMGKVPAIATSVALGAATVGRGEELEDARNEIEELKQQLEEARFGVVGVDMGDDDIKDLMKKLEDYQTEIDALDKELRQEKERANDLAAENKTLQSNIKRLEEDLSKNEMEVDNRVTAATALITTKIISKEKEIQECNDKIEELENARLANLDVDAKTEIEKARKETKAAKIDANNAKKEKENMEIQLSAKDQKMKNLEDKIESQKSVEADLRNDIGVARKEKQKAIKDCEAKFSEKEKQRKAEEDEKIRIFENKIRMLEAAAAGGGVVKSGRKSGDPAADKKLQRLEAQMAQMKQQRLDDQNRIKELDRELKETKMSPKGGTMDKDKRSTDKKTRDLEKKLEMETKKFEREQKRANDLAEELDQLKKDHSKLQKELATLSDECEGLRSAAATGAAMAAKVTSLEAENKHLTAEVKTLTNNYNTERVLRKKYYNMVEDLKGKIRVYCRYRPMSKTERSNKNKPVVKAPDEYTIQVEARGNMKEFQFDQVFTSESTQEQVFEDTYNLVQSAVDGFNVCIFAYGQTGSGKTYTMIGDGKQTQPGIAPRAFRRIFDLIEENKGKLKFQVSCYMLELYNDNLLDLLAPKGSRDTKLDVKKDKKGMVYVQGSVIQKASSSEELFKIFEKGSESRHVASTKMNAESSRSHLVVAIILESTNLTTGAVTRGKLSLVDLAGSERVGKTGATAQQLKEANSINKSLSALGDVISALSSDQSFIPYRNNKLTMLMQDSLGGNAKTLMFVNISPADYNADETAISLT